ncbi:unnamed protein product [Rangifer tarandus platyrhynchus]|uniref:Uncharacterized protein n=2 Tax=Rangifer tarandus platyrhynchus TaxID=3082113 RepID=A0AC59YAF4_RANTA|nr:unnamed protein product [Rangifer tarandus platyrhynchus]
MTACPGWRSLGLGGAETPSSFEVLFQQQHSGKSHYEPGTENYPNRERAYCVPDAGLPVCNLTPWHDRPIRITSPCERRETGPEQGDLSSSPKPQVSPEAQGGGCGPMARPFPATFASQQGIREVP